MRARWRRMTSATVRWPWLTVLVLASSACTGLYFDETEPPATAVRHTLATLPQREHWSGLVFNGEKIGFGHMRIDPIAGEPDLVEIRSEAALRFRLLTIDKRVTL